MHPNDAARIAEGIPGWMTAEELRWLAREASKHERILEVGTYLGRSTAAMALVCPGEILSLDVLVGELGTPELHGSELGQRASQNIAGLRDKCRVELRHQSLGGLYMEWRAGLVEPFSLVFIDGNHNQSEVMFDVWAAKQMVAPGGVIAGHDWSVGGVTPALELELPEARPVAGSIWMWRAPA